MILRLKRIFKGNTYTIGHLYINEEYFSDTIEDIDRGLSSDMSEETIKELKIQDETAIPTGEYKIEVSFSPRYKKNMPILLGVKGFSGIRIHSGNTDKDTSGCILCGYNKVKGKVLNSRETTNKLYQLINEAIKNEEEVRIIIE